MAEREPIPNYSDWQTRNFDRVYRLCDPANPSAVNTYEWYEGRLGDSSRGQRSVEVAAPAPRECVASRRGEARAIILRAFSKIAREPNSTLLTIQAVNAALSVMNDHTTADDSRAAWRRLHAVVEEMEAFFVIHSEFLTLDQKLINELVYGTRN